MAKRPRPGPLPARSGGNVPAANPVGPQPPETEGSNARVDGPLAHFTHAMFHLYHSPHLRVIMNLSNRTSKSSTDGPGGQIPGGRLTDLT
ncbi:unnamed protein product [Nezara viridula]|uniref:Uncharacterized protein n=1 Tax=Nezara viridula TaxID=85310 RepID=A0A9P0HQH0_NEZVI|nr:unnamed protein product [Nezara viridula]